MLVVHNSVPHKHQLECDEHQECVSVEHHDHILVEGIHHKHETLLSLVFCGHVHAHFCHSQLFEGVSIKTVSVEKSIVVLPKAIRKQHVLVTPISPNFDKFFISEQVKKPFSSLLSRRGPPSIA